MKTIIESFDKSLLLPASLLHDGILPGQSGYYTGADSADNFKKNLIAQPKDWHYRTKEIIYSVNGSSYRAPEWDTVDWANSVVMLGCSMTSGVGLAEDETSCYQLSKLLNRPVINLGVGGSGPIFSFQNSVQLDKNFPTPWAIVQNWSAADRMSEYTDDKELPIRWYGAWTLTPGRKERISALYPAWVRYKENVVMHSYFAVTAAAAIWKNKTRYCSVSHWTALDDSTIKLEHIDYARDLLHPGRLSAIATAETIAKSLNAQ